MVRHKNAVGVDIHIIHFKTYADAAARTGDTSLVAADIGKIAKQTDDNSYYVLTATTPTWDAITASSTTGEYSDGGESKGKDRTLGNKDDFDLGLLANDIVRIHIQKDGKVGFGKTDPSQILDLVGKILASLQIHVGTVDAAFDFGVKKTVDGQVGAQINNASPGVGAFATFSVQSDGEQIVFQAIGTNFTGNTYLAGKGLLATLATQGMVIVQTVAGKPMSVNIGGSAADKEVFVFEDTRVTAKKPLARTVTAGITAFATGGQGSATALTTDINEISTVGTTGDSVKLLSAVPGLTQTIINNGANACDVFPNTGDNLGAGVDTAVSLAAGSNITYAAYDTTNWESV